MPSLEATRRGPDNRRKTQVLVLSRKQRESVELLIETCGGFTTLGTVTVHEVSGNRVKLAFQLRKDVRILREEMAEKAEAVKE